MKNFIQATLAHDNSKITIAVDKIIIVVEDGAGTFVQTGRDNKTPRGADLKESYDEIIAKIEEASK